MLRLLPVLALVFVLPCVRAQTVRTVTLAEAVALARDQGAAVRQAATLVDEREAAVAEARGRYYPSVSAYTSGGQTYGLSFDQTAGQLTQQTTEALQIGGELDWTVYDGGARRAQLAAARADLAASASTRDRTVQVAVSDVFRQFYALAAAQAESRVARENADAQRQQLALVDATIDAGIRPRVERIQQEERVAEADLAVLRADRAERGAALQLVRLLALDPAGAYRFVPPSGQSPDASPLADEDVLVSMALERRPDLQAQASAVRAAEANVQASRAAGRPSLALVFGYGTSFTTGAEGAFTSQLGTNRGGALGLRIGVPLLDGSRDRSRTQAATARADRARLDAEDGRRAVALDVREAVLDYRLLQDEEAVAERRLDAARAVLEAETARYRLGATTLAALADVRARAVAAEVTLEQARVALLFQQALIDFRTGVLGAAPQNRP